MSRESTLLAALSAAPATTSELYDRVGYPSLTRIGLIPYDAFRGELARLAAEGHVAGASAPDGSTAWRLTPEPPAPDPTTEDR